MKKKISFFSCRITNRFPCYYSMISKTPCICSLFTQPVSQFRTCQQSLYQLLDVPRQMDVTLLVGSTSLNSNCVSDEESARSPIKLIMTITKKQMEFQFFMNFFLKSFFCQKIILSFNYFIINTFERYNFSLV